MSKTSDPRIRACGVLGTDCTWKQIWAPSPYRCVQTKTPRKNINEKKKVSIIRNPTEKEPAKKTEEASDRGRWLTAASQKPREGNVSTEGRNQLSHTGGVKWGQWGKIIIGDLDKGVFNTEKMSRIGVGWVANGTARVRHPWQFRGVALKWGASEGVKGPGFCFRNGQHWCIFAQGQDPFKWKE